MMKKRRIVIMRQEIDPLGYCGTREYWNGEGWTDDIFLAFRFSSYDDARNMMDELIENSFEISVLC